MGLFDGLRQAEMMRPVAAPQGGLLGGLRGFLAENRSPGNFMERLNLFGAQLQDIDDGGNRAQGVQQSRLGEMQAGEMARQRQEIARLAQGLNLTPQQQFLFAANPEVFVKSLADERAPYTLGEGQSRYAGADLLASRPADPTILNTRQGVYQVDEGGGRYLERFPEPVTDAPAGFRWSGEELEYIPGGPADPTLIRRQSDSRRAPPRARVGGASSRSASQPSRTFQSSGIKWD